MHLAAQFPWLPCHHFPDGHVCPHIKYLVKHVNAITQPLTLPLRHHAGDRCGKGKFLGSFRALAAVWEVAEHDAATAGRVSSTGEQMASGEGCDGGSVAGSPFEQCPGKCPGWRVGVLELGCAYSPHSVLWRVIIWASYPLLHIESTILSSFVFIVKPSIPPFADAIHWLSLNSAVAEAAEWDVRARVRKTQWPNRMPRLLLLVYLHVFLFIDMYFWLLYLFYKYKLSSRNIIVVFRVYSHAHAESSTAVCIDCVQCSDHSTVWINPNIWHHTKPSSNIHKCNSEQHVCSVL